MPVLGTITDSQESEIKAVEQLWPEVPHQICQFQADAVKHRVRPMRSIARSRNRCAKRCSGSINDVRKQIAQHANQASAREAEQLAVLDDYADGG